MLYPTPLNQNKIKTKTCYHLYVYVLFINGIFSISGSFLPSIRCYINANHCLYLTSPSQRKDVRTLVSAIRAKKAGKKLPVLGYGSMNFTSSLCVLLVFWFKTMLRAKNSFSGLYLQRVCFQQQELV